MGKNFDSKSYYINDFKEWYERDELVLAPYFQRRSVWSEKARSYLIDTILRDFPIPKIYMRHKIDLKTRKSIREIVDGQQRLRTILSFLKDGFKILKTHNREYGGLYFSQLPVEVQDNFLKYELSADLMRSSKDELILDTFARLNTYTVSLNKQELINARYFGDFKQIVYSLAREFYHFWTTNKIITRHQILRMDEAELTSELIIVMIDGIQSKTVIESYYKKYDDRLLLSKKLMSEFKLIMDTLGGIFEETLPNSNFHRKPQFYSLFCVIYDLKYGLNNNSLGKRIDIKPDMYPKMRNAIEKIENIFDNPKEYSNYTEFVDACTRHTTNMPERRLRHKVIGELIINEFEG